MEKENSNWRLMVALLFGGWMAIWIYRSMLSPVYEEIQHTIGRQSNTAIGLIASCYFLGYTILQIPSGILVKRYGQKKVIVPGFLIFAIGTCLTTLSKNINSLYIGSFLAGTGCGSFYGAAFSLTVLYVPQEKKGISTAIVNSGCAAGLITGLMGSGFLVKKSGFSWQFMGVISIIFTLIMVVLFSRLLKTSQMLHKEEKRSGRQSKSERLITRNLAAGSILYFATCYVYYLIITWLPDFLSTERGIQGGLLGVVSALISVAAVPGGIFFAGLSDRKKEKKVSIIVFLELASALLVVLVMLSWNLPLLSVVLLLYGLLGKISVDPVLISYLSDKTSSENFPLTLGIFNCIGMSSSVVAPFVTGIIKDATGSGAGGFYMGAAILAVGTGFFYLIGNSKVCL